MICVVASASGVKDFDFPIKSKILHRRVELTTVCSTEVLLNRALSGSRDLGSIRHRYCENLRG
jgi:hypothetical protein